jgi:FKBP-type peptidyl-prolyl cis-trans isomerase FkpA
MTEVTRVPIKPINKWSLIMLFVGIVIGLAIAGAFAWYSAPKGVDVDEVTAGTGAHPKPDDVVFVRYTGKLDNGTVFDKSQDAPYPIKGILPAGTPLPLGQMLPGFRDAVVQMQKGGKYEVTIPADKAYGATPPPGSPIPANADLHFDIELVDFMPLPEAERRFQVLQQQMMSRQQQQAPQGGAAAPQGGAPAPAQAPQGEAAQ